jgi:hypothetical protein
MGYISGLVALLGIGSIMLSLISGSIDAFILTHLGFTVGFILLIIGIVGFIGSFKKDGE